LGTGRKTIASQIVLIITVIFTSGFVAAYGEITYASNSYRLNGPPTYCIEFPGSDDLSFNEANNMVTIAQQAVNEWKTSLQEKETENKLKWNMNSKVISGGSVPDDCSIHLTFEEKTHSPDSDGISIIGTMFYGTDKIEIYYVGLKIARVPNIILHEIGHTFGLGHYFSDDNDINKSWYTKKESPSIMIPTMHQDPSMMGIRDIDVNKIRALYGSGGFGKVIPEPIPTPTPTPIPTPIPTPTPIPVQPISPISPFESLVISEKNILIDNYSTTFVTVTGQIKEQHFLLGQPVYLLVKNPDFSTDVLKITATKKGFFQFPMTFDRHSLLGQYVIEGIYQEQTDSNSNIKFSVSKKTIPILPSEQYKEPEPVIPTNAVSGKYLENISINSENNDYFVTSYLSGQSPGVGSVRITAENECPFKKEIFQKDYQYRAGFEVSFSFYQLSEGKPQECSIHLTVSNFDGIILETIITDYKLEEPKLTQSLEKPVPENEIPDWVKNVTSFWCDDLIGDEAYVEGLQFMIDNGIIVVTATSSEGGGLQEIPEWVKNNACWWSEGLISDEEFVNAIEFLIQEGIIQV